MILLALIFMVLATLALALLTGNRWPELRARLPLIAAIPALAFAIWQAAQAPSGWPAHSHTPADAEFVWAAIREPDPQTHDRGEIDLWLTPPGSNRPRSYRLPYSRQLHAQALRAMAGTKHGQKVRVSRGGKRGHGSNGQSGGRLLFYKEPPVVLPRKQRQG